MRENKPRCILGVFAHPDDETSGCAGTLTKYAQEGVEIYIVTATRGEMGELGTGGLKIEREDLPMVREAELRSVLKMYGVHEPYFLGYKDQEVADADFEEIVLQVVSIMANVTPDVVITFGPSGISSHEDHKAVHRAAVEAFHRYRKSATVDPRLLYIAIPAEIAKEYEMDLDESETDLSVVVDISEYKAIKIKGLRKYSSQQDAQDLADMFESRSINYEWFHQAYPPLDSGGSLPGFWD